MMNQTAIANSKREQAKEKTTKSLKRFAERLNSLSF